MSSNCQSPWQVTHARRCHLSPAATLCHRLPLLPPPPVATIFGQITCFKVPLAKPASQAKPTRLKSCHSVFQLCLATCDHRRCQFGPLQLGLHLCLCRCRCRCGVLSSANCSRRYYPGASISKQLTDAASEPVKQRDERTDRDAVPPVPPTAAHPRLPVCTFMARQNYLLSCPSLSLFLSAPSLQLSTRELASDRSSLRVAAVAGYKGNLICWQFSVNCRPPFVCPHSLPPCTLLCLPNLICAFLYLWLVDSFSLIGGRFAFRLPIWSESCGRFVKSQ